MTPKQKQVLDFLVSYERKRGYMPTQKEIAEHFEFRSLGTVQDYLNTLQSQGLIEKKWNGRRATQIISRARESISAVTSQLLPILGQVAAGRPIEVGVELDPIEVPSALVRRSGVHFVLQVLGDSMIDEGILSGDFAVVRKQSSAEQGETVVATLDGAATIKKFHKTADSIFLLPANPVYTPIEVTTAVDFRIEGILTGIVRQYSQPRFSLNKQPPLSFPTRNRSPK